MPELLPLIDHLLAALFLLGVPVFGLISHRNLQAAIADGLFQFRRDTYTRLILVQSMTAATLISYWLWAGRTPEELGFLIPGGKQALIGVGIFAACAIALWWMRRRLRGSEELRTEAWDQLIGFIDLLPHNKRELRLSYLLAAVVGICEELVYRGFLIWWLEIWFSPWPAVILASIAFGFAHLYQGKKGILKTAAAGFVFALVVWFSETLLLAMALHALVDAHAFRVALLLQNRFEWTDQLLEPTTDPFDDSDEIND